MSRVDHGVIECSINGTEYTLKPTLDAYRKIQARFGGLRGALEAISALNIEHLSHIVAAGAGIGRNKAVKIEEDIFLEGVGNVTESVAPFVTALFNPRGDKDEDAEGND